MAKKIKQPRFGNIDDFKVKYDIKQVPIGCIFTVKEIIAVFTNDGQDTVYIKANERFKTRNRDDEFVYLNRIGENETYKSRLIGLFMNQGKVIKDE